MNIEIPKAANDTPYDDTKVLRFKGYVSDQAKKCLIDPKFIQKYNSEVLLECMWDIQDFSKHFSIYIQTQWFNTTFWDVDTEVVRNIVTYYDWKTKNKHLLERQEIIWNINSIEQNLSTIQNLLLNKLWIQDDVLENADTWDRIAWEIESRNIQEA